MGCAGCTTKTIGGLPSFYTDCICRVCDGGCALLICWPLNNPHNSHRRYYLEKLYHIFGPVCLQVTSNGVRGHFTVLKHICVLSSCYNYLQSVLVEFSLQSHRYVIDSSLQVMVYRHIYVSVCL